MVDTTMEEETCTLARSVCIGRPILLVELWASYIYPTFNDRLMMGVTAGGTITALKKEGPGSLDPESIFDMMEVGFVHY